MWAPGHQQASPGVSARERQPLHRAALPGTWGLGAGSLPVLRPPPPRTLPSQWPRPQLGPAARSRGLSQPDAGPSDQWTPTASQAVRAASHSTGRRLTLMPPDSWPLLPGTGRVVSGAGAGQRPGRGGQCWVSAAHSPGPGGRSRPFPLWARGQATSRRGRAGTQPIRRASPSRHRHLHQEALGAEGPLGPACPVGDLQGLIQHQPQMGAGTVGWAGPDLQGPRAMGWLGR